MVVEPDTEVVQRHPRRQPCPQPAHVVGPLPAKTEGVVELVVDGLYDLADARYPTPKPFGPAPLAFGAFGWADELCPVSMKPSSMVILALKAFVDHVGAQGRRSYALEPGIGSSPQGEEAFSQRLILCGSRGETKTGDRPCWVDSDEQAKPLVASQAVGPADVGVTGQPSLASSLRIPNGHRRGVQSLVVGVAVLLAHPA